MKPPKTIYLQTDEEAEQYSYEGVTWCVDQINTNDKQYILSTPEREAASDLLEALRHLLEEALQTNENEHAWFYVSDDAVIQARAAIAQATKERQV